MITLNLIPEKEKNDIKLLNTYLAVKNLIFLFVFTLIVSTIVLLGAKITLSDYFIQVVSQNSLTSSNSGYSETKIRKIKHEVITIKRIQDEHMPWIKFFVKFSDLVPQGVIISDIAIDKQIVTMSAIAKKRDSLLIFQENLKKSGYFEDFKLPYDVLFAKENIKFTLKIKYDVKKILLVK